MGYFAKALRIMVNYPLRVFSKVSFSAIIVDSNISKKAAIAKHVDFRYSSIGDYSYVGARSCVANTQIGRFCSIASDVTIGGGTHNIDSVSSSPVFCRGRNILKLNLASFVFDPYKQTTILNDVWIGTRAVILQGTAIGNGAVIGAGAVVTKDVPDYAIVAGNPAKLIRMRFDDETKYELLKTRWWDWSDKEIAENASRFNNSRDFLSEFGKKALDK